MNKSTASYILVITMLVVTSAFSLRMFFAQRQAHDIVDIRKFPYTVGDWHGKDLKVTEKEYEILETRNLILREYTNPKGDELALFIVYSETNRAVFHPPEVCLIGEGLTIVDKQTEKISSDKNSFRTNKLYTEKNKLKEITLYCYKAGNLYTENFYLQQIYLITHQIFGKQTPGATIRVSMPVKSDEQKATATLKVFLSETVRIVDSISQ